MTKYCIAIGMLLCFAPYASGQPFDAERYYVATNGNDGNPGTWGAPFATLERARDAVRETLKRPNPPRFIGVRVGSGTYTMTKTFTLGAEDSGTDNTFVDYSCDPEANVILHGGITIPPSAFSEAAAAPDVSRMDKEALPHIVWTDLKALGVTDFGDYPDQFIEPPNVPELFFDDERMTLAQWPNDAWAEIDRVVESGPAPWRQYESDKPGKFVYKGDRPARWTSAPAVWLQGYWCFDWASETIKAAVIDSDAKTITLSKQHGYGIGSGNPAPRRYRAVNLLEELDSPGEYCLERTNGALYFWPPAPLVASKIVLSTLATPVISIKDAGKIMLNGFTITASRGIGIEVTGGKFVDICNCTVFNTGLDGIVVTGGMLHDVSGCTIYDTGTAGVRIGGGDRVALTSCDHHVMNNDIGFVSRRRLTHAYPVHLSGVGVHLLRNSLHDAPHQGIGLGGNEHDIAFNEVYNICTQSDDCGAFYMGRNPSERGTTICYNYWHDIGGGFAHGSCAIYFDDGAGGQLVYGNLFQRAAGGNFGAVFSHGGHDNIAENNIFMDCKLALGSVPWDDARWNEWLTGDLWKQWLLKEVDIAKPPYLSLYPELQGFMEPVSKTRNNYARKNVFVRCGGDMNGNWVGENNWSTNEDPGFVDMAHGDLTLRKDAAVFQKIPGFEAIPFKDIGLRDEGSPQANETRNPHLSL